MCVLSVVGLFVEEAWDTDGWNTDQTIDIQLSGYIQ